MPIGAILTPSYHRYAEAFFARLGAAVPERDRALYSDIFRDLDGAGIFGRFAVLGVPAAANFTAGSKNLIANNYTLTAVGSNGAFTQYRGVAGDNSTSYYDTGFAGNVSGDIFTQTNNHLAMWTDSDISTDFVGFGGGGERYGIVPRRTTGVVRFWNSNGASVDTTATVSTSKGMTMVNRSGSSAVQVYKDNSLLESLTPGNFSQTGTTFKLGATSTTPATLYRFCAYSFGSSMTQQEALDYYTIMKRHFDAIGVSFT